MRNYQKKVSFPQKLGRHKIAETHSPYTPLGKQIPLFELSSVGNGNGRASFRDPAFGENKNLPIHRWVPWIAGYSASFVDDVICVFLSNARKALVLDPFCGVGTTLLQALLRGHDAIGFEINPYPALAARAKLNALSVEVAEFDETLTAMRKASTKWPDSKLPARIIPHPPSNPDFLSSAQTWRSRCFMPWILLIVSIQAQLLTSSALPLGR